MATIDERLGRVEMNVDAFNTNVADLKAMIGSLQADLRATAVDVQGAVAASRLEMDRRFEAIDRRFEAVDRRFEAVDSRFLAIDGRFDAIELRFQAVDRRFETMEQPAALDHRDPVHDPACDRRRAARRHYQAGLTGTPTRAGRTSDPTST